MKLSQAIDFYTAYHNIFAIKLADTDELREQVFRLRYQVYCVENSYNVSFGNGLEREVFDDNSVQSLLIYKPSNTVIGTVRIILPNNDSLLNSFPLQKLTDHEAFKNIELLQNMTELSRFAISKEAREMLPSSTEIIKLAGGGSNRKLEMKIMSYISLGLVAAAIRMVIENGKIGAFAIMEPALLRLLAKMGIIFNNLGELVEYHGMRQPCYIDKSVFQTTKLCDPDIWAVISDNGRLEEMAADTPLVTLPNSIL